MPKNNTACHTYNYNALNALRGIGAIAIVLYHYNKLTLTAHWDSAFPFFDILRLGYEQGGKFVELFFLISGICFFKFYSQKIMNQEIGGISFLKKRILKLYPLYLFTTVLTVILQQFYYRDNGNYFEYNFTADIGVVIKNILGIARGWTDNVSYPYNAPSWFLSVLILMYIVFFAVCFLAGRSKAHRDKILLVLCLCLVVFGLLVQYKGWQYPYFILVKILGDRLGWNYYSPVFFLCFFAVLIAGCCLERKAGQKIRQRIGKRKKESHF